MVENPATDPLSRYLPPATAEQAKVDQRNWFYHSLSPEARDRFLMALQEAESRGLSLDAAWEEAVVAAETAYTGDVAAPADVETAEPPARAYDPYA